MTELREKLKKKLGFEFLNEEEIPDDEKNRTQLMRLNYWLARKENIKKICWISSVILFLASNYLINTLYKLLHFSSYDLNVPTRIFSWTNLFVIHIRNLPWYVLLAIFLLIWNIRLIYNIKVSYGDNNVGQKGDSRFSTLEEIKKQYKEVPEKGESFPGKGGIPISHYRDKFYIDDSTPNSLFIGTTGSGKDELLVLPMIDIYSRAEEKPSMLINDPKLRTAATTYQKLKERGFEVFILNLIYPEQSMGFNPLTLIVKAYKEGKTGDAQMLTNSFAYSIFNSVQDNDKESDPFWANNSTYLLSALILAHISDCLTLDEVENIKRKKEFEQKRKKYQQLSQTEQKEIQEEKSLIKILEKEIQEEKNIIQKGIKTGKLEKMKAKVREYVLDEEQYIPYAENEKKINMYSIINTFTKLAEKNVTDDENLSWLDVYFIKRPEQDIARFLYSSIRVSGGRTKGSIFSNTLAKLSIFTYKPIAQMTAESSIDLLDIGFGKKPIAIFLGIPDFDSSNHFLATVFIRQVYFILSKQATYMPAGKCNREIIYLLNEAGNMPQIHDLAHMITVGRERGMKFCLGIQAFSQLDKIYGKDAKTIIGNCGNQIYLLTNENETAEQFSKSVGNKTNTNISRSGKKLDLEKNITELYETKALLNSNQLMELKPGEIVVKRVMKRTDLEGIGVKPHSIFNHNETKMPFRYQYLADDFPSGIPISALPVNKTPVDIEKRVFDPFGFMERQEEIDQILSEKDNLVTAAERMEWICSQRIWMLTTKYSIESCLKEAKDAILIENYLSLSIQEIIEYEPALKEELMQIAKQSEVFEYFRPYVKCKPTTMASIHSITESIKMLFILENEEERKYYLATNAPYLEGESTVDDISFVIWLEENEKNLKFGEILDYLHESFKINQEKIESLMKMEQIKWAN